MNNMFKKIMCLLIVIGSCFFLNGCWFYKNKDLLNYHNYDVVEYGGNNYYKYKSVLYSYEFIGEREQVGYIRGALFRREEAYILKEDVEKNIIFITDGSGYFWLKEGCEFVNENTEVKCFLISENPCPYDGELEDMIFFEIEDLTYDKLTERIKADSSSMDPMNYYFLLLGYGNGIYQELVIRKNIIDNEYYFLEDVLHNGQYVFGWYKISDKYMEIIKEKILEYEEEKLEE